MGSRPSSFAISAMNDWIAQACATLLTERNRNGIRRTWLYKYEDRAGIQRSFTADAAGLTLAAARKWAGGLEAARRVGRDPAQERDAGQLQSEQTFEAALRAYLPLKASMLRASSYREVERNLLTYLKPLHRQPLGSINTAVLSARLAVVAQDSGHAAADNARRTASAFWNWAMRQGLVSSNPVAGVERRKLRSRDRVLDANELRAVWAATDGSDDYSIIVRLLMLSGMRASEVGSLQWSEVFSDRIILPAVRTKSNRALTVPLTPQIATLLATRQRGGLFVFGQSENSGFGGWSKAKRALDARAGIQNPWRVHDLRRTLATGASELSVAPARRLGAA